MSRKCSCDWPKIKLWTEKKLWPKIKLWTENTAVAKNKGVGRKKTAVTKNIAVDNIKLWGENTAVAKINCGQQIKL